MVVRLLHVWVSWCNGPKSCLDAKVCYWHSHSRAVYMAQCCQSIQLPPTPPPWKPSLRSAKKKKMKGSIIFYRSSPVALNRERCTSIIRLEDVVSQSVSQVSDVCQVSVHFPVPLTSHPLKKSRSSPSCHFHPVGRSGEAEMAVLSSSRAAMEGREKNEASRLKDAALSVSVVVVSQANRGY